MSGCLVCGSDNRPGARVSSASCTALVCTPCLPDVAPEGLRGAPHARAAAGPATCSYSGRRAAGLPAHARASAGQRTGAHTPDHDRTPKHLPASSGGCRRAARRAAFFAYAAAADGAPDAPQAGYAAAEAAVAKENELADLAAGKDARLPALEEDALEKEEIAEEKARGLTLTV